MRLKHEAEASTIYCSEIAQKCSKSHQSPGASVCQVANPMSSLASFLVIVCVQLVLKACCLVILLLSWGQYLTLLLSRVAFYSAPLQGSFLQCSSLG